MRLALYLIGLIVAAFGGFLAYSCRDTLITFNPTPVQLEAPLTGPEPLERLFEVGKAGRYEVRLQYQKALRPIEFNVFDQALEASDVRWEVLASGETVAKGESLQFSQNSYSGPAVQGPPIHGRVIGEFTAEPGTRYKLSVLIRSIPELLHSSRPTIQIRLNGNDLSDLANIEGVRIYLFRRSWWVLSIGLFLVLAGLLLQIFGRTPAAG